LAPSGRAGGSESTHSIISSATASSVGGTARPSIVAVWAFIFCFTLCWNEFIYALTFLSSTQNKTVPVAIVNEFVDGDIYRWGSLMAGALVGSLPLVVLYAFFVEHYVSAMTGAVKE
jgi:ABC-type glycerol-3-phosphate transport system permease component